MIALLAVLLPIAELFVIVVVATRIGVINTIGLLIVVSVVGGWLVKRQGVSVLRRLQRTVGTGEVPHREMLDGFLLLMAGALLMVPGFLTDIPGLLLLLPPVRVLLRRALVGSFTRRSSFSVRFVEGFGRRDAFDVDSREVPERRRPPPEVEP